MLLRSINNSSGLVRNHMSRINDMQLIFQSIQRLCNRCNLLTFLATFVSIIGTVIGLIGGIMLCTDKRHISKSTEDTLFIGTLLATIGLVSKLGTYIVEDFLTDYKIQSVEQTKSVAAKVCTCFGRQFSKIPRKIEVIFTQLHSVTSGSGEFHRNDARPQQQRMLNIPRSTLSRARTANGVVKILIEHTFDAQVVLAFMDVVVDGFCVRRLKLGWNEAAYTLQVAGIILSLLLLPLEVQDSTKEYDNFLKKKMTRKCRAFQEVIHRSMARVSANTMQRRIDDRVDDIPTSQSS